MLTIGFLVFHFSQNKQNQWWLAGCWYEINAPVYGLPQHQAVISVEIVWELGNSSVCEVMAGLQGAVVQCFVLPLSQNQQAVTACRHNLHTEPSWATAINSHWIIKYWGSDCFWISLLQNINLLITWLWCHCMWQTIMCSAQQIFSNICKSESDGLLYMTHLFEDSIRRDKLSAPSTVNLESIAQMRSQELQ